MICEGGACPETTERVSQKTKCLYSFLHHRPKTAMSLIRPGDGTDTVLADRGDVVILHGVDARWCGGNTWYVSPLTETQEDRHPCQSPIIGADSGEDILSDEMDMFLE